MIDNIFAFCCWIMTGLGNLLHLNYMTINVILFCYIEPIFTGLMLLLSILSSCKLPVKKAGSWFFWIVVSVVVVSLFLGGINFFTKGGTIPEKESYNYIDQLAEPLFYESVHWLKIIAVKVGTTYEAINLILFVFLMPAISIISYIAIMITPPVKESNGDRILV